jgi:hypothetical protein
LVEAWAVKPSAPKTVSQAAVLVHCFFFAGSSLLFLLLTRIFLLIASTAVFDSMTVTMQSSISVLKGSLCAKWE